MKEVSRLLSFKQLVTTPYHPMCNGLVERFNGTLKSMIVKMCRERPKDWDRYVTPLLFAYREVPQASLGFSPFELLYGRSVRGPMRILRELWMQEELDPEVKSTYEYVLDLRNRLQETCQMAQQELTKSQGKQQKYYNRKAKDRVFKTGDKVLLLLSSDHSKLLMQWKGPYEVLERVGISDYRVQLPHRAKVFHANMLKQYHERPASEIEPGMQLGAAVIESDIEEDKELEVIQELQTETYKEVIFGKELLPEQLKQAQELVQESQDKAFKTLKHYIASPPVLVNPDFDKPFVLQTDASQIGTGAILLQEGEDGHKHPVAFASKKLLPREVNYSTIERECLAIVWGIQKFQEFLYGKQFILETDHQPLQYLGRNQFQNGRLMRWALALQPYSFVIHAIRGRDNVGADFLSRHVY
jgi:hypothetical protein